MKIRWLIQMVVVVMAMVVMAGVGASPMIAFMQSSNDLTLDNSRGFVPDELASAILSSLQQKPNGFFEGSKYIITSARIEDDWALVSIVSLDGPYSDDESGGTGKSDKLIIAQNLSSGFWIVALEGTEGFVSMVQESPDNFISSEAKQILNIDPNEPKLEGTVEYKWPWAAGVSWDWWQTWKYTNGRYHGAMDFGTSGADRRVLASARGVITSLMICNSDDFRLEIKDADGVTLIYNHFDQSSLDTSIIAEGKIVPQGQVLGSVKTGNIPEGGCGNAVQIDGTGHLHWGIPKDGFTVEGYTISEPNNYFVKDGVKYWWKINPYQSFLSTNTPGSSDTTPPTGGLTAPAAGTEVNKSVTIKGTASDSGSGVDYVLFRARFDGKWRTISKDTSAPYEYTWDLSGVKDQTITLGFDVFDKAGNVARSPGGTRKIIKQSSDPRIKIDSPASNSEVVGNVTIRGWAADLKASSGPGVTQVHIYLDGTVGGGGTIIAGAEYGIERSDVADAYGEQFRNSGYTYTWDTSEVSPGKHTLYIYAKSTISGWNYETREVTVLADTTPPDPPKDVKSEGTTSGVWQNIERQPSFTWSASEDALSDVEGYFVYWGEDPKGTSETIQTDTSFEAPEPIADEDGVATYYLRFSVRDTQGNTSAWYTLYTFLYDNSKPSGDAKPNFGWGVSHSIAVPIGLFPEDSGSGVSECRLSSDEGKTWGDWQPIRKRTWWQADGEHGETVSVAVQYRDAAGNVSDTINQSLELDYYPSQPSTSRYQLSNTVMAMGGMEGTSQNYILNGTTGQVLASGDYANSNNYQTSAGFWVPGGLSNNNDSILYLPFVRK